MAPPRWKAALLTALLNPQLTARLEQAGTGGHDRAAKPGLTWPATRFPDTRVGAVLFFDQARSAPACGSEGKRVAAGFGQPLGVIERACRRTSYVEPLHNPLKQPGSQAPSSHLILDFGFVQYSE